MVSVPSGFSSTTASVTARFEILALPLFLSNSYNDSATTLLFLSLIPVAVLIGLLAVTTGLLAEILSRLIATSAGAADIIVAAMVTDSKNVKFLMRY